jgi:carboxymethylenebutenolidase
MTRTLVPVLALSALTLVACGETGSRETGGDAAADRMAEEHEGDRPVAGAGADTAPASPVEAREVAYANVEGEEITGYLATPEGAGEEIPGLIVIHEWWGLNDNIRTMTRRLAGEGYAALAVDLYRGRVASTPDSARSLMGGVQDDRAESNLRQAYGWLDDRGAPRIGAIGWCFGGGWSLRTALLHPTELDADVIYYGQLVTDQRRLSDLDLPIQGHFGAEDSAIPPEEAHAFEEALNDLGIPNEIYVYQGAGHAFANPSGERYQPEAARQAWDRTVRFLDRHLNVGGGDNTGMASRD